MKCNDCELKNECWRVTGIPFDTDPCTRCKKYDHGCSMHDKCSKYSCLFDPKEILKKLHCPCCGQESEIIYEQDCYGGEQYRFQCDCGFHSSAYSNQKDLLSQWEPIEQKPAEPLPCPICYHGARIDGNMIFCDNCGAHTDPFDDINDAISVWNKRV